MKYKYKTGSDNIEINKIYNEDCRIGMKLIPDNSIATCITDPPYNYEFIGKEWNVEEIKRRLNKTSESSSKTLVKNIPYGSGLAGGTRNKRWYERNRENILDYQQWTEEWACELYRIMKSGGLAFIFNSTRTIAHIQVAFENAGFYARDILVWRRHSGIPKGLNIARKLENDGDKNYSDWEGWHSCLRNEWEAIVVVQKPLENNYINTVKKYDVGLFKAENGNGFSSNILEGFTQDKKDEFNTHATVKPLNLIKYLIELSTPKNKGHIIIDPFMGSGTTAVACKELGYDYIGYEMIEDYIKIANRRILEIKNDLSTSL